MNSDVYDNPEDTSDPTAFTATMTWALTRNISICSTRTRSPRSSPT